MKWFHISNSDKINKIARTNDNHNDECIIPSVPEWIFKLKEDDPYREPDHPPRICVAPSVWQCVSGLGKAYGDGIPKGKMYAYEISIAEIADRTFESLETKITDEHWIVDELIDDNAAIKIVGSIEIERTFIEMKKFTTDNTLNQLKELDEWESIWERGDDVNGISELNLMIDHLKTLLTW